MSVACPPARAIALRIEDFSAVEAQWRELEAVAPINPYLSFAWLSSWTRVYRPTGLRVLRVEGTAGLLALGLLEESRWRRSRFAGAPVSPATGLMCRPGAEAAAWAAVEEWVSHELRWPWLEVRGLDPAMADLPRALLRPEPWYDLSLGSTFEAYLGALTPSRRREASRRMRRASDAGITSRHMSGPETVPALEAFVRLHRARATQKGEVHRAIDERLGSMLAELSSVAPGALRATVLEHDDAIVAVAVTLEQGAELWAYNSGYDPAFAHLSPGLLLRLNVIEDAVKRGKTRYDLGPGDFAYKREQGGRARERLIVQITGRGAAGRTARTTLAWRERIREVESLRRSASRARRLLPGR